MARHASPEEEEEEEDELDELERAEAVLAERKQKKSKGSKGKEKERSSKSKGKRRESDRNEDASDSDGVDGDDSDEEGGGRRGTGKAKKGLSESDITEKARDLVRYAICNEASRRPLRRDEINKRVLAGASRSFQRVFEDANEMLKTTFGMELVALYPTEVEDVQPEAGKRKKKKKIGDDDDNATTSEDETADRPKSKGKKRKGLAKMFCLRSTLAEELIRKAVKSNDDLAPQAQIRLYEDLRGSLGDAFAGAGQEEERRGGRNVGDDDLKEWKRGEDAIFDWKTGPEQRTLFGILYVILALILVNERVLTDEQLQSHLKRLELRLETPLPLNPGAIRPEKQTVNTFLQTLIRQQYLEKSKLATGTNAKSKGGSSATQATQTQTQRVRATQGTNKKQTNDDTIAGGDPDAEWRWGPRAFREVGEDGIASFVKDFYRSHARTAAMAGAETTQKDSKTLMADIQRGATGGKPGSALIKARDEDD